MAETNPAAEWEELYAHTPNQDNEWHRLADHLLDVACRACKLASKFEMGDFGYDAGLLHDAGKVNPEFQKYLRMCKAGSPGQPHTKIPHSVYGCYFCKEDLEFIRPIIAGHHAGIYAMREMAELLSRHQKEGEKVKAIAKGFILQKLRQAELPDPFLTDWSAQEVVLRFLYSCLVDADSRSTAIHDKKEPAESPARPSIIECAEYFQTKYRSKFNNAEPTELNRIRREVYEKCLEKARQPQGVYRLTAPTGSGKTYALMAFALEHAKKNELERVVVALPYTSIIDQNAKVYRDYLPKEALLEHHSGVEIDPTEEDSSEQSRRRREAAATWEQPVIITTTVQLFESLFSNKRSRCRKLHNLTNSVIVLDEAQTLPPHLLEPTVDLLNMLVKHFGVTVVLSTATQPALGPESSLRVKLKEPAEILDNPTQYFRDLERVTYQLDDREMTWKELAEDIRKEPRILVVLNRKKDAVNLWKELKDLEPYHLSGLLCPAHRKEKLAEIKPKLKNGQKCCVISTQVVEAGVDLDFPVVYRAFGPLDRIVQAAGRCNREGRSQKGFARVFLPSEGGAPRGEYGHAMEAARIILRQPGANLHDPELYEKFFKAFYRGIKPDLNNIQDRRKQLDYPTVNDSYEFIEKTYTVVIQDYPKEGSPVPGILARVHAKGHVSRGDWQELQQYAVSLRRYNYEKLFRGQDIIKDSILGIDLLRKGIYHPDLGIGEPDVMDPMDLII
jgi:CRISPR-associated endonuclease/helicase Cas3